MRKVEEPFGHCEQEMWSYSFGSKSIWSYIRSFVLIWKRTYARKHGPTLLSFSLSLSLSLSVSLSLSLSLTHTHTHTHAERNFFLEVRLSFCESKMTKSLFPSPYHSTSRTCSSFSELHFYKYEKEGNKNPLEATSPPLALLYSIYFF